MEKEKKRIAMTSLQTCLASIYGVQTASQWIGSFETLISSYQTKIQARDDALTERDSMLITYGDQAQRGNEKPLQTLKFFSETYLTDVVQGIHILPFYPWTSDDGFSVVDYRQIDKKLGDWEDVSAFQPKFKLMFDAVINHISSQSEWFQKFLVDDSHYQNYFVTVEGEPD